MCTGEVPQGLDDDVDEAVVLALVVLQPLLAIGQLPGSTPLAAHHKERRESFMSSTTQWGKLRRRHADVSKKEFFSLPDGAGRELLDPGRGAGCGCRS